MDADRRINANQRRSTLFSETKTIAARSEEDAMLTDVGYDDAPDDAPDMSRWDMKVAIMSRGMSTRAVQLFGSQLEKGLRPGIGAVNAVKKGVAVVDEMGKLRCPPGTANAMEFTDTLGSNCGIPGARVKPEAIGDVSNIAGAQKLPRIGDADIAKNVVNANSPAIAVRRETKTSGKTTMDISNFDEEQVGKMLSFLKAAPGFGWIDPENPKHAQMAIDQLSDNLMNLMGETTEDQRKNWARWYDIANEFDARIAKEIGIDEITMHAVTASLSPQKDWDQNTAMAEHLARLLSDKEHIMSEETAYRAYVYAFGEWKNRQTGDRGSHASRIKRIEKDIADTRAKISDNEGKDGKKATKAVAFNTAKLENLEQKLLLAKKDMSDDIEPTLDDFVGKNISEMDVYNAAASIRAHSEVEGGTYLGMPESVLSKRDIKEGKSKNRLLSYRTIFGKGGPGDHEVEPNPKAGVAATSFATYMTAIKLFRSGGDMDIIDAELNGTKVRSFFNNIAFPNDTTHKDVTIDTHAVAGNLMVPVAADHLITSSLAFTHVQSTGTARAYPLLRQAMVLTAERWKDKTGEDYLPRQIQSITWERMRELVPDTAKKYLTDRMAQIQRLAHGPDADERFIGEKGFAAAQKLIDAAMISLAEINKGKKKAEQKSRTQLIEDAIMEIGLPDMGPDDLLPRAKKKDAEKVAVEG
jgi:hypothetical protein